MLSGGHIYVFLINMMITGYIVFAALKLYRCYTVNEALSDNVDMPDIQKRFTPRWLTASSPFASFGILLGLLALIGVVMHHQLGFVAGFVTISERGAHASIIIDIALHGLYILMAISILMFITSIVVLAGGSTDEDGFPEEGYLILGVLLSLVLHFFIFTAPLSLLLSSIAVGAFIGTTILLCRYPMDERYYALIDAQKSQVVHPIVRSAEAMTHNERSGYLLDAMTALCIQQRWVCLALLSKIAPELTQCDKWQVMVKGGLKGYFNLAKDASQLDERFAQLPEELHDYARPAYTEALSQGLSG